MLRSLKDVEGYKVAATNGEVGKVVDFLFDDERWAIRYLVVETGGFFGGRPVLISPISFREIDWSTRLFHLALTKDKIKDSPAVDVDKPVSRQRESDYCQYYGYPYYWGAMGVWGVGYYPALLGPRAGFDIVRHHPDASSGDAHLRSAKEVSGYDIRGTDDGVGFVSDLIVDDESWQIRYLVVDTSHWWWGHKVLVGPQWTGRISWSERKVHVDLSRAAITSSPAWDASSPIRRDYEARLHEHYGLGGYWGERPGDARPKSPGPA